MNTNAFKERLPKFKQELPSIIFISAIQIWWCFNYPLYTRLGTPWNTLLGVGLSIVGIIACIYIFTFADKMASVFNFDSLAKYPYSDMLKKVIKIYLIACFHFGIFIIWYNDFCHLPHLYYVLSYINFLIIFVLFLRAMNRPVACD